MAFLRRTVWVSSGLLVRMLMMAVLLMFVRFILDNRLVYKDDVDYSDDQLGAFKLQSHTYVVASAIAGTAGNLLQIPVAMYLLCKSKKTTPSAMILDISMHADIVSCCSMPIADPAHAPAPALATNDAMRLIRAGHWGDMQQVEQHLISYYKRAIIAVVFLLVGMLLSLYVTLVSARLRARAMNDSEGV